MPITLNVPLPILSYDASRPAEFIDPRGSSGIKNLKFNRFEIKKRPGTVALGSSMSERVQAIFELIVEGTGYVVRVGNTKVELLNKTTSVWSDIAGAALTGLDEDRVSWAFPLIGGSRVAVFTNGVDNVRKYTGTGNDADLGGSPPECKYLAYFGGYLFLAGIEDYAQRVQWSDTGDPEEWAAGNAGSTDLLDDQESITGMSVWGRYLSVHKKNSIYIGQLVSTTDIMVFDRKSTGVGTVCHHTIQELPTGEQIFLAVDGIRIFNGATAPRIDAPVNDEIREQMNPQYFNKCWSVLRTDLDEYWVAVAIGSQTEPDTIYKYNWFTGQVYKDERLNISAASIYIDSNTVTIDELEGTIDSQTWRLDTIYMNSLNARLIIGGTGGVTSREDISISNDIGIAIDGYLETKDFTALDYGIQEYGTIMRWKGIEHWLKGDSVDFAYSTNGGDTWVESETLELDSNYNGDDAPLWAWFDVVSSMIRFRWRNNTAGEGFTMKKYAVHAVKRGKRK